MPLFKVFFDDVLVKEATVNVLDGYDASKCCVSGDGLKTAIVGQSTKFAINAQSSFPGSPFRVIADYPYDPTHVVVTGLQSETHIGCPVLFDIDASRAREAPITVTVPPIYQQPLLEKDKALPRLYHARFTPVGDPGSLVPVDITYDGKAIPNSPFLIKLLPETDVNMMTVSALDGSTRFLDVCASREVAARIDVSKCGKVTDLKVLVLGPDTKPRDCFVCETGIPKQYEVRWPTDMAGTYKADVFINGKKVDEPISVLAKKSGHKEDIKLKG
ncbi:unnamed protein product [Angiostrongylus costaricensis]|uniref:Filamin/ABP280 repeat protein n=1 Tax=Angiostrongylus costaricensis TaxID=334426 RepID=A0A0R3PYT1_ANGCS|nr:unnamed protein product [Angiostrongylus costaricensis]